MRVLYHLPLSPYSRKVRLALAEKQLPHTLKIERIWERRQDFLAMNPAATVPVLQDANGLVVADSYSICEYLDEAYQDNTLIGRTFAERVEVRRLVAWFDDKFASEVTRNLLYEKQLKRLMGRGNPDAALIRAGYANLKPHMQYIGWLSESRPWLAGQSVSLADFAAAAHISSLDYIGDVDWSGYEAAKDWYAKVKSRPSFRDLLADRISGTTPPAHYSGLDF